MKGRTSMTYLIRHQLGDFTAAERKVAKVLLSTAPTVGLESSTRLADVAGVSGATVIRFVNRLGFEKYADFQRAIHDELRERVVGPTDLYPEADRAKNTDGELLAVAEQHVTAIQSTFAALRPADVERAVGLLTQEGKEIVVLGGWFSHTLAEHMATVLAEVRGDVGYLTASPQQMAAALADLGRRSVCVIFDFRRFEADLEHFGRRAARNGAAVVLITDQWLSPLVEIADVTLIAFVGEPEPFESHVASTALVEMLIGRVIDADLDRARSRSVAMEALAAGFGSDTRSGAQGTEHP